MGIRNFIAEWLSPETFRDADGWRRLKDAVADERHWLGDFPEACAFAERTFERMRCWERKLDDPIPAAKWGAHISDFREQLNRGDHLK